MFFFSLYDFDLFLYVLDEENMILGESRDAAIAAVIPVKTVKPFDSDRRFVGVIGTEESRFPGGWRWRGRLNTGIGRGNH